MYYIYNIQYNIYIIIKYPSTNFSVELLSLWNLFGPGPVSYTKLISNFEHKTSTCQSPLLWHQCLNNVLMTQGPNGKIYLKKNIITNVPHRCATSSRDDGGLLVCILPSNYCCTIFRNRVFFSAVNFTINLNFSNWIWKTDYNFILTFYRPSHGLLIQTWRELLVHKCSSDTIR